ncbi:FecCD family ABC transporter permease [Corynebacterium tapiri]|uniref:Iron ABC transporter permease n=1 Tax=Corynebacterium tapiri TaxID=1448266 RepID=A0A5C4U5P5_9CORY|nr:iron ABC transporter permease [Corynebacterium tapiri]TNL98468.1 iron ABC transporter permease [Corynebacterium tapiri]
MKTTLIGIAALFLALLGLCVGEVFYTPTEVAATLAGQTVPGASFTVLELRLPRVLLGALVGIALGAAGCTLQTLLRNKLASPDIIGVSSAASVAGVMGIVLLGLTPWQTSVLSFFGSLAVCAGMFALAAKGGFSPVRLILIGIGVAAISRAAVTYVLSIAAAHDLPAATRWLNGSLGSANLGDSLPVAIAVLVCLPVLIACTHHLDLLRFGETTAISLGSPVNLVRVLSLLAAVALVATATAACGPVAFVAFLAGPIAAGICGPGRPRILAAAFVGASLMLLADLIGQYALPSRLPVGVVTGAIGAPYLLYLLVRHRGELV